MNPNSRNQIWSRWTFTITPPPGRPRPRFQDVKANAAQFARKAFGSATEMKIKTYRNGQWVIDVRTEGAPVHDQAFVDYMAANWRKFLRAGFGEISRVEVDSKLEAGSRQDGTPSDQLILAPSIVIEELQP